ncbi:MAG: hypothetical protein ACE5R6_14485 [Candidatus Heimdallarchaeota archaeon]
MGTESERGLSDEVLIRDAIRIAEEGEKFGVHLRLLGALAIWVHSSEYEGLHTSLNRLDQISTTFTDIDFIGYQKQSSGIRKLFEKQLNFQPDKHVLFLHRKQRLLYYHPDGLYHIDIFLDTLNFSHQIVFGSNPKKGRLQLDFPTVSLADLLLAKLQIHEITEKDIKDLIVLLRAHKLGFRDEKEVINLEYVSSILSDDWGFWFDAKTNLEKVKVYGRQYRETGILSTLDLANVVEKVNQTLSALDTTPKPKKWQKRAVQGTNKPWWRDVEEIHR